MTTQIDVDDLILNFDPARPQSRFRMAMDLPMESALPHGVPWPKDAEPKVVSLTPAPAEDDDLSRFHGYDAVVVTWTAAEASALAAMFTPDYPTSAWYQYRHRIDSYIPLVTGLKAPFNSTEPDMARYYHSLGLYFPCTIGKKRVLLFKSGLHLDYDGPATPVRELIGEIASAVGPRLFVTTGTGGGIGTDVHLGDVVVAAQVRFDCQTQFRDKPFATRCYQTEIASHAARAAMTPALMSVNAARIPGARSVPAIFSSSSDAVVTTDCFAFDDSTNHFHLQGLGRACDMGDAMVADALSSMHGIVWHSIRNASDPQIPNPDGNLHAAAQQAALIYAKYGGLTTAASVIATWALIHSA